MDDKQPLSLSRELLPGSPGLRRSSRFCSDLSHDAAEPGRIQQDLQARYGQNYRLA